MKVGLGSDGLTLNSQKINPASFSIKGISVDRSRAANKPDTIDVLGRFNEIKEAGDNVSRLDKFKALLTLKEAK